jgi:hypothetical protein
VQLDNFLAQDLPKAAITVGIGLPAQLFIASGWRRRGGWMTGQT